MPFKVIMKSFGYEAKKEVANVKTKDEASALSFLSAIIKTSGEIQKNSKGEIIIVRTELLEVYDKINELLKLLYNSSAEMELMDETVFNRAERYEIYINAEDTKKILLDCELMYYDEDKYLTINNGISKYIVEDDEQARSYIRGAFLGAFTCNIVNKEDAKSTGYHAEFVFNSESMAQDFSNLLAESEIITKKVERKNLYVVYLKEVDLICDLLSLVGATKSMFALQNQSAIRSIRNNVNRQNNCVTGNLTKTIDASVNQVEAIKTIIDTIGLETLDVNLQNVANLRLANPEESLEELVVLSGENISKSGLYHRLKKIEKIAKELK